MQTSPLASVIVPTGDQLGCGCMWIPDDEFHLFLLLFGIKYSIQMLLRFNRLSKSVGFHAVSLLNNKTKKIYSNANVANIVRFIRILGKIFCEKGSLVKLPVSNLSLTLAFKRQCARLSSNSCFCCCFSRLYLSNFICTKNHSFRFPMCKHPKLGDIISPPSLKSHNMDVFI